MVLLGEYLVVYEGRMNSLPGLPELFFLGELETSVFLFNQIGLYYSYRSALVSFTNTISQLSSAGSYAGLQDLTL